jgi:hypothetical protein
MAMSCYTDWKYIAAGEGGYAKGRNLLRYLQYRDDRINHIPRAGGPDRWVDCGLGSNWREILDNASELQTDKVLLRSLIIRPPQDLVAELETVDPERWASRRELLEEVVHRVMDAEMERAGVQRPDDTRQPLDLPYSYVIHAPDDSNGIESTLTLSYRPWTEMVNEPSTSTGATCSRLVRLLSVRRSGCSSLAGCATGSMR